MTRFALLAALAAAAILSAGATALAWDLVWSDDLENGSASWITYPSCTPLQCVSTDNDPNCNHTAGGAHGLKITSPLDRVYRDLSPGDWTSGSVMASAWLYDDGTANICIFDLREPGATQVLGIGKYYGDQSKYQCRVLTAGGGGGGVNWVNTSVARSVGWHRFDICQYRGTGKKVAFAVDGVVGYETTNALDEDLSRIVVGFGWSGAADSSGYVDDISVSTACAPAAVKTQPHNQYAHTGGTAAFSVEAEGSPPFDYQWRKDGDDIPGANWATLTICPVQESDAGSYDCVVSNDCGSATSDAAVLTIDTSELSDTVTNTADFGAGSLRNAIFYANQHPGTQVKFNVPASDPGFADGVFTIKPTVALPEITADGTVIDGATQTAFSGDSNPGGPEVVISGANAQAGASGLGVAAADCVIANLVMGGFPANGVEIAGVSAVRNTIAGCYLGTSPTGIGALANAADGVLITLGASDNIIGGTQTGARNVISGNALWGVDIRGAASSNTIQGNYIGLDTSGAAALHNGCDGVLIAGAACGNFIGGHESGAGNIISGNVQNGVAIIDVGTSSNTVLGNYIGTNATGTTSVGNAICGIRIYRGATSNTIGVSGAGNLISGNTYEGVGIHDASTARNVIQANTIGLNTLGAPLGNNDEGIEINDGASYNSVGGIGTDLGNIIAANRLNGVLINSGSGNRVAGNFIGTTPSGLVGCGNGSNGILLSGRATNAAIGGVDSRARNIISGNKQNGVLIADSGTDGNSVQGNYIGTDPTGSTALLNTQHGVYVTGGSDNAIGGVSAGAGNVISGNSGCGVWITGTASTNTKLQGNLIGTNAAGSAAMPNTTGVYLSAATSGNTIGGAETGARNVISGNRQHGVYIADAGTGGNTVRGNYIGTNAAGTAAVPNFMYGVGMTSGAANNIIGGGQAGEGNLISGNRIGILIPAAAAARSRATTSARTQPDRPRYPTPGPA